MIGTAELVSWLKALPEEEPLIESLRASAVAFVNEPGGPYFGPETTLTETVNYRGGVIQLSSQPQGAVTLEEFSGGAWVAVPADQYVAQGRIIHLLGRRTYTAPLFLRASYPAGYEADAGDPDAWNAPDDIKQAVRLLVAHWFANREAAVVGTVAEEIALGVERILRNYR